MIGPFELVDSPSGTPAEEEQCGHQSILHNTFLPCLHEMWWDLLNLHLGGHENMIATNHVLLPWHLDSIRWEGECLKLCTRSEPQIPQCTSTINA